MFGRAAGGLGGRAKDTRDCLRVVNSSESLQLSIGTTMFVSVSSSESSCSEPDEPLSSIKEAMLASDPAVAHLDIEFGDDRGVVEAELVIEESPSEPEPEDERETGTLR